jgi:hypothetical protein
VELPADNTSLYIALFIRAKAACLMTTVHRTATLDPAVNMVKFFDLSISIRDGCPL